MSQTGLRRIASLEGVANPRTTSVHPNVPIPKWGRRPRCIVCTRPPSTQLPYHNQTIDGSRSLLAASPKPPNQERATHARCMQAIHVRPVHPIQEIKRRWRVQPGPTLLQLPKPDSQR